MYKEAVTHLRAVGEMEPSDLEARLHLALAYALGGRPTLAMGVLDEEMLADDTTPLSLGLRVILSASLGMDEEAVHHARVMRERFPKDRWALRLHAEVMVPLDIMRLAPNRHYAPC